MSKITELGWVREITLENVKRAIAGQSALSPAPIQAISPVRVPTGPQIRPPVHPRSHRVIQLAGIRIASLDRRVGGLAYLRGDRSLNGKAQLICKRLGVQAGIRSANGVVGIAPINSAGDKHLFHVRIARQRRDTTSRRRLLAALQIAGSCKTPGGYWCACGLWAGLALCTTTLIFSTFTSKSTGVVFGG